MTVRDLDEATLRTAARDYAGAFLRPTVLNPHNRAFAPIDGRGWVLHSMEHFHFEDEFKFLMHEIRQHLGPKALAEFDSAAAGFFTPYDDGELAHELAERLAITPDGKPIPGKVGSVVRDSITIGWRYDRRGRPRPVHAQTRVGEDPEEAKLRTLAQFERDRIPVFPLIAGGMPARMALNPRISNEAAIAACDAIVDRLDEGTGAGVIQGRSGAQPADPDTAVSGTLLFTLTYSDPAFGNAADANPGGRATANAITNDSSADATGTLGYCRASATNDGVTPLDDHIDGEAGTSGADYNFNTVSIVSGATISLTSQTVTVPES